MESALTEYRLHADLMFLPNPTGKCRFNAQERDMGHPIILGWSDL
jgi:hypothetical protein